MDVHRRTVLESLVAACDRALAGTREPDDPFVGDLLHDVRRLRADVCAQLGRDDRDVAPPGGTSVS